MAVNDTSPTPEQFAARHGFRLRAHLSDPLHYYLTDRLGYPVDITARPGPEAALHMMRRHLRWSLTLGREADSLLAERIV